MDKAERLRQRLTQQAVVVRVSSKLSDSVRTLTENELGQIDCAERLLYVWALELVNHAIGSHLASYGLCLFWCVYVCTLATARCTG